MVNFTISNDKTDKEITVKYGKNCLEAISASTAMTIYKTNGMEAIGEKIIVAKAGSTNFTR
jgi:sulfur transfer protein SufE